MHYVCDVLQCLHKWGASKACQESLAAALGSQNMG